MPRISVIVPVYKAEAYLDKCVGSVLTQRFTDWELILVDDGSPDGAPAMCDRFAAQDSRVRVLHQKNGGVSMARNNGMAAAKGDLIAFLDSDDWLAPDALAVLHEALVSSSASTAACGNYLAYADGPAVPEAPPLPAGTYTPAQAKLGIAVPLLCDRLREGAVNGYVWRYLFDRRVIEASNLRFSGAYLEDELFLIEYFSQDVTLAVTDAPLYYYYQNPNSVTRRYLPTFVDTFLTSLALKEGLVERYAIPVTTDWRDNTCWAGLLMEVGNQFSASNPAPRTEKCRRVREVCRMADFAHALAHYVPQGMGRNKTIAAQLLRRGLIGPLSLLYAVKNRR